MHAFQSLLRLLVVSFPLALSAPSSAHADNYLPLVDLGYEIHQASFNVNFSLSSLRNLNPN